MKIWILISLSICTLAGPITTQADYVHRDAAFTYVHFSPAFNFYDEAWGFEGELRRWVWRDDTMGWSAQIGIQNWGIVDQPSQINAVQEITSTRGAASFLLGGLSWIMRPDWNDRFRPMLEVGTRFNYGLTSASANVPTGPTTSARGGGIDIASQITGIIAVTADYRFNNDWIVQAGLGYQFDIVQGEMAYAGQKIADNELSAPFARIGIIFDY